MSIVSIHQREFNVDCIVFDKDGTLIDFNTLWGARILRWVEAIAAATELTDKHKKNLYFLLGYSPQREHVRPESPLAVASLETLYTLAAGVICQAGIPWHQALSCVISSAQDTSLDSFDPSEIQPKGDVVGLMRRLVQAGIHIAIVTSDDRHMTEATLEFLEVNELVSLVICGDDPIPNKPAPDALRLIATQLGIQPIRMMMVGDTTSDMQFAANAGVAFRIGIASTSRDSASFATHADTTITSIDEIKVCQK